MTSMDRSDLKAFVLLLVIGIPLGTVRAIGDWGPWASGLSATAALLVIGGLAWGFDPGASRHRRRRRATPK